MHSNFVDTALSNVPCNACQLSQCNPLPGIGWRGNTHPKILFIGESISREDVREEACFSNKPSQYLFDLLKEVGINIDDCAFSNILQCIPLKDPRSSYILQGNTRAPTEEEILLCQPRLIREIVYLKPEIIVPLGTTAAYFFLGIGKKKGAFKVSEFRGKQFDMVIGGVNLKVYPTVHPNFVARNPTLETGFKNDLAALSSISRGTFATELPTVEVLEDTYRVLEVLQAILDAYKTKKIKFFAMDFETSTLLPWQAHARILSAAICFEVGHSYYIPFYEHGAGLEDATPFNCINYDTVVEKLKEVIATVPWGNQNAKFDFGWAIQHWDAEPKGLYADPMIMAHIIYGELRLESQTGGDAGDASFGGGKGFYSLKALARDFLQYPDYDREVKVWMNKTNPPTFANIPLHIVAPYAGIDAEAAYRLILLFEKMIKEKALYLPTAISTAAAHSFAFIELNGIAIDTDYLKVLADEFPKKVLDSYRSILSQPIIQEYLEERYALRLETYTEAKENYLAKVASVEAKQKIIDERYAKRVLYLASKNRLDKVIPKKVLSMPKMPAVMQEGFKHWSELLAELDPYTATKADYAKIGLNLGSAKQIAHIVFDIFKLTPQKEWLSKKTKLPSVSKSVVKAIAVLAKSDKKYAELNTFTEGLIRYREDTKILSTYVNAVPNYLTPYGVLHSNYHITGTRTGRLSTSNFSVHTTPKSGRSPIKNLFVSRWRKPLNETTKHT